MVVHNSTDSLYIKLGSVPTTEMPIFCSYELVSETDSTPKSFNGTTDRTTYVAITEAISSGQQIIVKSLFVTNINNEAYTVEIGYYDGTNRRVICKSLLKGGSVLQFTLQNGWAKIEDNSVLDLVLIKDSTSDPSLTSGYSSIYSMNLAGKSIPKIGADDFMQEALYMCPFMVFQGSSTSGSSIGDGGTNTGSLGFPSVGTTNIYTSLQRTTFASVVTTANQTVGRYTNRSLLRGNAAGIGGFFACVIFGLEKWTAGDRLFVGVCSTAGSALAANPSALTNMCGFGIDAGDTAITLMHNDGSGTATKDAVAGQPALANNNGYRAFLYCKPNDTVMYWRLDNINSGAKIAEGNVTTDLPTSTTALGLQAVIGNGSNVVAGDATIGLVSYYVRF